MSGESKRKSRKPKADGISHLSPAELRALFGPKPDPIPHVPKFTELRSASSARPELACLEKFREATLKTREEVLQTLEEKNMSIAEGMDGTTMARLMRCNFSKEDGNYLFKQARYEDAIAKYIDAMRALLGPDVELPTPGHGFLNEKYLKLFGGHRGWHGALDLMACSNNISQSYVKRGQLLEALDWFEEICREAWMNWHVPIIEYYTLRMKSAIRVSQIYRSLGNSGTAWFFGHKSINYPMECPTHAQFDALTPQVDLIKMECWRHPEPSMLHKLEVTEPKLQVRGVWKKVAIYGEEKPKRRHGVCGWVWKGKWYVVGGQYDLIDCLEDMWCLDLKTFKWRRLPDFPDGINHKSGRVVYNNNCMIVWKDAAWRFVGERVVWKFDLINETWCKVPCKLKKGQIWPYAHPHVQEYSAAVLGDNLYIFGGDDQNTHLGTNIFMSLNLRSLEWTHLGGISECVTDIRYPPLRDLASMWAVPHQDRIYLLYGNADRSDAKMQGNSHGSDKDYTLEDIWTYSPGTNEWRRERFRGNPPCPRTEMACVYHPGLDRVIVYGGYNGSVPSLSLDKNPPVEYSFTFYGDTFVMDPKTGIWQQVLIRGFPSYRAQASFFVDDETGKVYLYGGYTNSSFVPSSHHLSRTFSDVWQLTLECEGGWLTPEELARDKALSQLGPWKICAACSNAGTEWRKCGGKCGGKVFYCSAECQKEGWKAHKEKDGCTRN